MLTRDSHALLRGGCSGIIPFLESDEEVGKLDHPGIYKHERRVAVRDEGRALDLLVTALGEEVEK